MLPTLNNQPKPAVKGVRRPRGRDMANDAIRLRVYIAKELRRQSEQAGLEADQWSSSAVTSTCIALERLGLRGIPADADCDVV